MNKKKLFFCVLLLVFLILVGATWYMMSYALSPREMRFKETQAMFQIMKERYPTLQLWIDSIQQNKALKDTFIVLQNQERSHALYIRAQQPSANTAIVVHGYKECATKMLHIAHLYASMGFNVLLPDLHAHGLSAGNKIQMGWKDRLDVLQWSAFANKLFAFNSLNTKQVLHGISMGAATVMCVSGEKTPAYVRCFIEDCGYTSVWDEFKGELKNQFGLPTFPLLYSANAATACFYGWSFKEASPLKMVEKCKKPMLFIHGDSDTFVPTHMVYELYRAKPQPKALWITTQTAHAESYKNHPQEYAKQVKQFLSVHF